MNLIYFEKINASVVQVLLICKVCVFLYIWHVKKVYILFLVLFVGCTSLQNRYALKGVLGKELSFPDSLTFIYDSVHFRTEFIPESVPRLVFYVDSSKCTTCWLSHFESYREIINLSEDSEKFQIMFILAPSESDRDKVYDQLRDNPILYPLFVDDENVFLKMNSFIPHDSRFHSIGLDSNNIIRTIGDPTLNSKMKDLILRL